jgi:hypothetical protein
MVSAPLPGPQNGAAQLSDLFLQFSMSIDQIRANNPNPASTGSQSLGTIARQLDELSDELNAAAIGQILQNIQPNIDNIIQTTKAAQEAVKRANSIQKIFNIAGATLTLASSILSGNPSTIVSAVAGVATAVAGGAGPAAGGNPTTPGSGGTTGSGYVSLNPTRAGLVGQAVDWAWSSVRAHLTGKDDGLVTVHPVLNRVPCFANLLLESN